MINTLKRDLAKGEARIGSFVTCESADMVEIMALGGFDFIIIDTEHGCLTEETTKNLVRAAEYRGITPIVRVTENTETMILRSLDVGAHGVQVPQINTVEDAELVVSSSKYTPVGNRGVALTRAANYGLTDANEHFKKANEETMVVVHCENIEGFGNLNEILKNPHIDVVFLGTYDMSQSLGIPGQLNDPQIQEIARSVVQMTKQAGKSAGVYVKTPEQAKKCIEDGFQYIAYELFDTFVLTACTEAISKIKGSDIN